MCTLPHEACVARPLLALLFLLLLPACGDGDASEVPSWTVRDSVGIRIVENRGPTWPPGTAWRLGEAPLLHIGADQADLDQQFYEVMAVRVLNDGGVVVAEESGQIRFYGPDGVLRHRTGASGDGPGEYRDAGRVWLLPGDSVLVFDRSLRRLSLLSPDGTYQGSTRLEHHEGDLPDPVLVLRDGSLLARADRFMFGSGTAEGLHRDTVSYVRYDRDGRLLASIGELLGEERFVVRADGATLAGSSPFTRNALVAPWDEGFAYATGLGHEVELRDGSGRLKGLLRRNRDVRAVRKEDRQRYAWELARDVEDEEDGLRWIRLQERMPWPDAFPTMTAMHGDAGGNLWLRAFTWPGDPEVSWTVFDGEGRELGDVTLPTAFTIHDIMEDRVAGVLRDELEVEHVQIWSLVKPEG